MRKLAFVAFVLEMVLVHGAGRLAAQSTAIGRAAADPVATRIPLRTPVADAVTLLGWYGDDVPRVELVADKPPDASAMAEAWVRFNGDGSAVPIIYVATDSHVYRDATTMDYQALVKLAGILAHERWHMHHGRDEVGAYEAELGVMEHLNATSAQIAGVRRALRWARQQAAKKSAPTQEGSSRTPAMVSVDMPDAEA